MKILNIKDPQGFFEKLSQCKGSIELVTKEGDRLNLKSKLCQYIVWANIFSKVEIGEMELIFSDPSDVGVVVDYLIRG